MTHTLYLAVFLKQILYVFFLHPSGVHSASCGSAGFNNSVLRDSHDTLMLYLSSFSFFQNPDIEKEEENDKSFLSSIHG